MNHDLWSLTSSRRVEEELDRATIVDRTRRPFVPGDAIPEDQPLVHFYRD
jgi:hypothetical protein